MMCDHCLAPDMGEPGDAADAVDDLGCDNMTVLIVALLYGRTKEEWYDWITDRVKQGYGYKTPPAVREIYSARRRMAFKAKLEARELGEDL